MVVTDAQTNSVPTIIRAECLTMWQTLVGEMSTSSSWSEDRDDLIVAARRRGRKMAKKFLL